MKFFVIWALARALRPLVETVAGPLIESGVLSLRRPKFLGLFPVTRFTMVDPGPKQRLQAHRQEILLGAREVDEDAALLVSLMVSLDLDRDLVAMRTARRRCRISPRSS